MKIQDIFFREQSVKQEFPSALAGPCGRDLG